METLVDHSQSVSSSFLAIEDLALRDHCDEIFLSSYHESQVLLRSTRSVVRSFNKKDFSLVAFSINGPLLLLEDAIVRMMTTTPY